MRSAFGQAQERALVPSAPAPTPPPAVAPTTKEIPYDYVATFALTGRRGNRAQDVINISIEGAFVAVAIGYSFIPAQLAFLPDPPPATEPPIVLAAGLSVSSPGDVLAGWLLAILQLPDFRNADGQLTLPPMLLPCLLTRLCGIDFRYSIIDSGTGRELQNLAIHNIAGLGKADGDRPFRPLAKPMLFMPRSTIRIEVEEISEGPIYVGPQGGRAGAQLFIVLHGYKLLGYYGTTVP